MVLAWKMSRALEKAKEQAQQLAEQAEAAKQPLQELFADDEDHEVTRTNSFSWMSTGFTAAGFGMPAISQVDGVQDIGSEFMEAVFQLRAGQTGVAVNQPQTYVYVVRVDSITPSEDLLRQRFLQTGISMEVAFLADTDSFELRRQWLDDLEAEMNVEWLRPPQT